MPDSNEPQQGPYGMEEVRPATGDAGEIPLADWEEPVLPESDPVAPLASPPEPPAEPIDEGAVIPD